MTKKPLNEKSRLKGATTKLLKVYPFYAVVSSPPIEYFEKLWKKKEKVRR